MAIITSVQQITITLNSTSNTTIISSVDTSKSVVFLGGYEDANPSGIDINENQVRVDLQSGTLARARRENDAGTDITVFCTVVELDELVTSVEQGEITLTSSLTGNATVTSVDLTRALVLYQGLTSTETSNNWNQALGRVGLTSPTNVQAVRSVTDDSMTINFTVIEFPASAVNFLEQTTISITATNLSNTDTHTAVDLSNSMLFHGGWEFTGTTSDTRPDAICRLEQTSTTVITATRADNEGTCEVNYTLLEFIPGILESTARNTFTLPNSFSTGTTGTGNTVDLDFAFVTELGASSLATNHDETSVARSLPNTTQIRVERDESGAEIIIASEILEFVDGALPGDGGFAFSQSYVM